MIERTRVGVVDKSMAILDALELGPHALTDLVDATGIARPTAHRLAVALEEHGMVARDGSGRFVLGQRIHQLAAAADSERLVILARPILAELRDATGESTQLYRREGHERVCVAVADLHSGLRDTVPLGARLTLQAGSAAQILTAWETPGSVAGLLAGAAFDQPTLDQVRNRGWAASAGERERGVASVSAPVRAGGHRVVAAVSLSGPIERLGRTPGPRHAGAVVQAAQQLTAALA